MKLFKVSIVILIVGCFCLKPILKAEAKSASILQFLISFDKKEYELKDPININFELKNNGSESIYVNKRFYVGEEGSDPGNKEVSFQVKRDSGEKLIYKASPRTIGFPKTDYFVLLEPKQSVSSERKKNLSAYFDLKTPGKYKVTATYQNIYGQEIGLNAVKDKIISKPVTIRIKQ